MRIGEWDCDQVCNGCEKEFEPAWCILAVAELMKKILESKSDQDNKISGKYSDKEAENGSSR